VNGIKKIFVLSVLLLGFLLSSCLEAEVEIDLKRDGSGEMRMKILPLESSMNFLVNEVEADLRRNQNYRESDIIKGNESDGRRSLLVRKKFKRIEEADENCSFTSHKEYDQFVMDIPGDFLGIVKIVRVNMPGQIITSNVGNILGRSLTWYRNNPADNRLVVSSKPPLISLPREKVLPLAIILAVVILGITFLTILTKIQKRKADQEKFNFCPECGTKANPGDNFCQNCGQSLK